jgi:hypothetical protein
VPSDEAADLDALRRRAERWTDLLVAPLILEHEVNDFAFDPARSADFAEAFATDTADANQSAAWSLLLPSLRLIFRRHNQPAPHWETNQRIASVISKCFPGGLFPPDYLPPKAATGMAVSADGDRPESRRQD